MVVFVYQYSCVCVGMLILRAVYVLLTVVCTADIQFWRNRKTLEGLSVRSVFFNVFQSLIVLLYVMDNETNFVVKVSIFIGLGIEIWKIHKVIDIKVSSLSRHLVNCAVITFLDATSLFDGSSFFLLIFLNVG
jgi:Cleft lip and palate transmembrane protein 1 (CLPTM1)